MHPVGDGGEQRRGGAQPETRRNTAVASREERRRAGPGEETSREPERGGGLWVDSNKLQGCFCKMISHANLFGTEGVASDSSTAPRRYMHHKIACQLEILFCQK
ncbi:hypothetical protein BRADI_4g14627v3 [Brachypodium distachyon]|uniref:Uncharacterized protein n=1 Tax=Brachypodium distachyon TaxID=15368 RepID=A0A2K2CMV4_BRADI|nr:hypothetical protein BRADI_4g14627v3 [Brachypodium distachyon]